MLTTHDIDGVFSERNGSAHVEIHPSDDDAHTHLPSQSLQAVPDCLSVRHNYAYEQRLFL